MKRFKEWLRLKEDAWDDQSHVFSDRDDWPGVLTRGQNQGSFSKADPNGETEIHGQTVIMQKINALEQRLVQIEQIITNSGLIKR